MRVSELARLTGVRPTTVRYYEDIGLLPPARRTSAGYRDFGEEDVERLDFVRAAQGLGMRLDEIAEVLALRDGATRPCDYVRALLRDHVSDIDRRVAGLERLRARLVDLDARADRLQNDSGAGSASCPIIDHVRRT
ncbi:heavy metal-responsive transcriptional regulator [Nocardiopsis sp. YSL2]|uniref:heavy metal-responsive transcriptional regulator n=1 Tax=Nocardiopsis sp. YSL2 TaxID=2939492 RepID=UPI0026F43162|nr:heavy metal-responsive transcriptional regulator [Nocardiopsis sp. YSL2]